MGMKPLRSIIRAPTDYSLISIDLSAAESWVVAHLASDANMKRELATGDLHSFSARVIYNKQEGAPVEKQERDMGKTMNHSCAYRTSPNMLTMAINKKGGMVVSLPQVKRWHERWHRVFNIRYWWMEVEEKLRLTRTLTTCYGKRRRFYGIWNNDLLKEATAYEPQSTVGYHMNGAIHPDLGIPGGIRDIRNQITSRNPEIRMIQTAHDSVLIECPKAVELEIAERASRLLHRPLVVNGQEFTIPVDCVIYPERWEEDGKKMPKLVAEVH